MGVYSVVFSRLDKLYINPASNYCIICVHKQQTIGNFLFKSIYCCIEYCLNILYQSIVYLCIVLRVLSIESISRLLYAFSPSIGTDAIEYVNIAEVAYYCKLAVPACLGSELLKRYSQFYSFSIQLENLSTDLVSLGFYFIYSAFNEQTRSAIERELKLNFLVFSSITSGHHKIYIALV